jgi:hypothetical protein
MWYVVRDSFSFWRKSSPEFSSWLPSLSLMLRPTVSRPVCLGIKHPSGAYDQIFITVRQMQVCWCGALSLRENGSAVYNCGTSSPAQSPWDSWPYLTVSDSWLHQPRAPGPRIYIPQEQGGRVIPPGSGFPFHRLLRLARATVEVFEPASTRGNLAGQLILLSWLRSQSQSHIATDGQSISKPWCRAHLGLMSRYVLLLTVTVLVFWGVLSHDRTGLSFVYASGPRQRSLSCARIPSDETIFTASDLRLPFSSPPTTLRVMVEVLEPASTRVSANFYDCSSLYSLGTGSTENTVSNISPIVELCDCCCGEIFIASLPRNGRICRTDP